MLGTVGTGAAARQVALMRDPGGPFKEAPLPEGGEGLQAGETLFGLNSPPLVAALEEPGGKRRRAGRAVRARGAGRGASLGRDRAGSGSRSKCRRPGRRSFEVLAIAASSPDNAWLLGRSEGTEGPLSLFRRHAGATPGVEAGRDAGGRRSRRADRNRGRNAGRAGP